MSAILKTDVYDLVDCRHGRFLANRNDTYIGRSMIEYGEYSEIEWHLLNQVIPKGGVVIEAGANMGAFTVPMAKKVGMGGMVYAFEPQLTIFQQLCANLALNDLQNVQAFNAGCGDVDDWINIARLDIASENNFGGASLDALKASTNIKVRVERLDGVLQLERLDLIKADVEGMEGAVMRGASELISKFRPLLYLEANDQPSMHELTGLMTKWDYDMWMHRPSMTNKNNFNGNKEVLYPGILSHNMMCAPKERSMDFQGIPRIVMNKADA